MPYYNTVLFDADGTLLDFAAAEKNAIANTFSAHGIDVNDEMISEYSKINDSLWKLLEKGGITKSELKVRRFELFVSKYGFDVSPNSLDRYYLDALSQEALLIDGAFELLSNVHEIADIYVITNGIKKVQEGRMAKLPIKHLIKRTFISEEMGAEKPSIDYFNKVGENIPGFDKKSTLVVGDSLSSDIKGAINAGIDCVWYAPNGEPVPEGMDITYVARTLAEIEEIVLRGHGACDELFDKLYDTLCQKNVRCEKNYPATSLTTFKLGGTVRCAVFPENEASLSVALDAIADAGVKYIVLGNGSDCVFHDGVYDGVVVSCSQLKDLRRDGYLVTAGCGVAMTALAAFARDNSLSGLEFSYGIPGSVGGGIYMNAGAYGGCMSDTLESVRVYDSERKRMIDLSAEEMKMSYRHSFLQENKALTLVSATFTLKDGDREAMTEYMRTIMDKRRRSQPLELPSAGSVFKRPADDIHVSRMIDEMGLKGTRVGGVCVSPKHAGFIVNDMGGTCADLKSLIAKVRKEFYLKHGFMLECEVIFIS